MNDAPITFDPAPSRPRLELPAGACDTHCHVFGPASVFPFADGRTFTPGDAPKEKLFALHEMLGIERCVIVQSACHGYDNAAVADAIAAKDGTYLGVALLPVGVGDEALRRHDAQGFRGVRFNYMKHLGAGAPIEEVIDLAGRLAEIGWHLQIHMDAQLIPELGPKLKTSPVPVVLDHMCRIEAADGPDQQAFRHVLRLMEDDRFLMKVSGCDRSSAAPPYADAVPFARKLVAEFGDRVLWGTDWPHPNHRGPVPDDGVLADLIAEIAPSEAARQALLVDNPMRFYRFAR